MPKRLFIWGALSACVLWLTAFNLNLPFQQGKAFAQLPPDTPLTVGITHVTLGDDRQKNRVFWDHTLQVIDSLPQHQGYLGHKVRKKIFGKEAWTMTIWTDAEALAGFVRGDTHSQAMQNGLDAVEAARFVTTVIVRADLPLDWAEAEALMNKQGRRLYQ